jgi:uncharacterized cupredoxin-like copper-binding protein
MPFEMKTIKAMPDGFEIEYTKPVDKKLAAEPSSYKITGFSYKYHATYGSPVINKSGCPVRGVLVSDDGMRARLVVDSLRLGYIHEITADGVLSDVGTPLLHNVGYYTLNNFPDGEKITLATPAPVHHHNTTTKNPDIKAPSKKTATAKPASKRITTKPASWKEPDYTINMGTKPGLKFSPQQFQVKAGSRVKIVFTNSDDMLHNLVVVIPGTAIQVGELAMKLGLEGQQKNYIPATDRILYHTNLLEPNTIESIYFTAPEKPGDYTYVCTVPGHFYIMQGIMKVVK